MTESSPAKLSSDGVRATLLSCLFFAGFGCLIPFLPLWLEKVHGFSGAEIGVVLAIAGFSRAVAGPVTAAWADGRSDRRAPLFMFTILLTAGFALLYFLTGFVAVFAVILVLDIAYWGLLPVVETALLRLTRKGQPTYGLARGLASAAFVVGTSIVGVLNDWTGAFWPIWAFMLVISAFMIAGSAAMPREPRLARAELEQPFGERLSAGLGMLRNPRFSLFVFAAGLIQASAGFLYTSGSLVWANQQGMSSKEISVLWNIGTLAEVGFLIFLAKWSARFRPETLIVAGGIGAVVRWTALAALPPFWLLLPLQLLHSLSFAATFLGGMRFIQTIYGDDRAPTAQMIYMGVANAPTYAAAVLISGPLYDRLGAPGYLAMTGIAGLGLVLAVMLWRYKPGTAPASA
ncbi:MFS transporter [Sandarakinorhabdus oryzae]|uniref:MFS transporter n=1 Tax=Sandarakinorhabdus oryzae TaxID=2675220 RepID=UPI0012E2997A|nr:MFS transporter [Sandarakinorhabdus oryzae]